MTGKKAGGPSVWLPLKDFKPAASFGAAPIPDPVGFWHTNNELVQIFERTGSR